MRRFLLARRRLIAFWGIEVAAIWVLAFIASNRPAFINNGHQSPRTPVEALSNWDGNHYRVIADEGYSGSGENRRLINFFPLYPTLAGLLGGHSHAALAGVLLSQLLTLASILLMSGMLHGSEPPSLLREPGFWMLLSPFGFFLFSFYSEALLLFLVLAHYAAFRANRPRLSFAAGFLAGLTRPTALTLAALLGFEAIRRWRHDEDWKTPLICALAPLLGVAAYVIGFVGWLTGDAGAYMRNSARYFPVSFVIPFTGYFESLRDSMEQAAHRAQISNLFQTLSTTAVLAALFARRKSLEPALLAYAAATLIFVHAISPQTSTGRFEVVLFPAFIAMAETRFTRFRGAWIVAAALAYLSARAFMHFAAWDWVA